MSLYRNIKKICDERGIKIGTLETELGIARGYISDWDTHKPNIVAVQKVADYLATTIDELVNGGEDDERSQYNSTTASG